VTTFVAAWRVAFAKHRGSPWVDSTPAKDRTLIAQALRQIDADRPSEDALALLTSAADRLCRNGIHWAKGAPSIGILHKSINDLLPKAAPTPQSAPPHPVTRQAAEKFAEDITQNPDAYRAIGERVDRKEVSTRAALQSLANAKSGAAFRAAMLPEKSEAHIVA